MRHHRDLLRLSELAQLALDHRLERMKTTSIRLDQSRTQLAAINEISAAADLSFLAGARAELTYQPWADHRRSELNLVIARQTAEWLCARDEARTAFGRLSALRGLAKSKRS